jgi:hypothetical protein
VAKKPKNQYGYRPGKTATDNGGREPQKRNFVAGDINCDDEEIASKT